MEIATASRYTGSMTYHVVVAHKDRNVIVKVDANDDRTAHDIAHWLVAHSQHREAHAPAPKARKA